MPGAAVPRRRPPHRLPWFAVLAGLILLCTAADAEAQLGNLLSPGGLSRPHAHLEGIGRCTKCHEQGRRVTVAKCLACHTPVAQRIARRTGVHREVKDDCVSCHAEHAGPDGELRPFDQSAFDHAGLAGFALTGKHATVATRCAACHKGRSFLTVSSSCTSCHADVHKGKLGPTCTSCHSTTAAFKDARGTFDHARSRFALSGAHQRVACEKCHVNRVFRGLAFATCTSCHRDPHRGTFTPACVTCHTTAVWHTDKVDHRRTAFPLNGRHATVACARCHPQPAMQIKPKSAACGSCHVDVHRGAFKQDCRACHNETGFTKAPFDHSTTAFPLTGGHSALKCTQCHKNVVMTGPAAQRVADFRGLRTSCVSCHSDVHQGELGASCETCHTASTFRVKTFVHPRFPELFAGEHAPVACAKCHTPATAIVGVRGVMPRFKDTSTTCAGCHNDVHLGQLGTGCQACHRVTLAKFAVSGFSHAATRYPLTGRHEAVACARCHERETGAFPAGSGTAVRFKDVPQECRACHADVHLGQLAPTCQTCHTTGGFKVTTYRHANAAWTRVFVGRHATVPCGACHKPVTGEFPRGRGTTVQFTVDARCVTCHNDVHRGALGTQCIDCHKP